MSFPIIYENSYEIIEFTIDNFMDYFETIGGKKLLLDNNINDINKFHKYNLYEIFIKNFDFYIKENKKIDIDGMRNQIKNFCEELVSSVYHPKRLIYYLKKYNYNICDEKYEYYLYNDKNNENVNENVNENNNLSKNLSKNVDIHIHKKARLC